MVWRRPDPSFATVKSKVAAHRSRREQRVPSRTASPASLEPDPAWLQLFHFPAGFKGAPVYSLKAFGSAVPWRSIPVLNGIG
jgi:hypothetical protein